MLTLLVEIMNTLKDFIPALSVLFFAFRKAFDDFIRIILVVVICLFGFIVSITIIFGG